MACWNPPVRRSPWLLARPGGALRVWLAVAVLGCGGAAQTGALHPTPAATPGTDSDDGARSQRDDEAAALWKRRAEPAALERALALWTARLKEAPADSSAALALTHALFFAANTASSEGAGEHHARGLQVADAALARLHPAGAPPAAAALGPWLAALPAAAVELLYWRTLHQLGAARLSGLARRAFETPRARAALEHCHELRPELDHGGPDRALGTLYAQPTAAALQDLARSKAHFEAALKLDPAYPANHLSYGRDWAVAAQDREAFATALRKASSSELPVPEDAAPEAALARASAELLLRDAASQFE